MWKKQKQYNTFMKDNLGGKRAEALRHIAFFFFSVSLTPWRNDQHHFENKK